MGNYRAATTDNVSRLPKHWLSYHDRGLFGVGFYGVYNGQQLLYWQKRVGTLFTLIEQCKRFWKSEPRAVVFRLSDGKIIYHHPSLRRLNPHFTSSVIAWIDDGCFVPWRKEYPG